MAGQTSVVGSHPEFPFRACSTGENLTPAAVRPIFSRFHSVCLVPRGAPRTVTPYPGDFPAGTSHVSVCLQTLLWCHNCDLMRAIFLTETILVISSSSLLPASTAGMGCGIYTHTHTHSHSPRVWLPWCSRTHWSSLCEPSLPSWVNSSVPDTCITGFQFISFQQPLANISSPFLFLLLSFTLSAKSLLVGLQLPL